MLVQPGSAPVGDVLVARIEGLEVPPLGAVVLSGGGSPGRASVSIVLVVLVVSVVSRVMFPMWMAPGGGGARGGTEAGSGASRVKGGGRGGGLGGGGGGGIGI